MSACPPGNASLMQLRVRHRRGVDRQLHGPGSGAEPAGQDLHHPPHVDHFGALPYLYMFGGWAGRWHNPLRVFGPAGRTPEFGTAHMIDGMKQMLAWHRDAFAVFPVGKGRDIDVTEFDFRDNGAAVQLRRPPAVSSGFRRPQGGVDRTGYGRGYRSRTSVRASSTACCSSAVSRPANLPRRSTSTARSCSTSTRVRSLARSTSGRNVAAAALRDVGATIAVDRPRSSSG
jgi:hypothetical protein